MRRAAVASVWKGAGDCDGGRRGRMRLVSKRMVPNVRRSRLRGRRRAGVWPPRTGQSLHRQPRHSGLYLQLRQQLRIVQLPQPFNGPSLEWRNHDVGSTTVHRIDTGREPGGIAAAPPSATAGCIAAPSCRIHDIGDPLGRMLKMAVSHPPALNAPRRVHFPGFVLASLRASTYRPGKHCLGSAGWAGGPF